MSYVYPDTDRNASQSQAKRDLKPGPGASNVSSGGYSASPSQLTLPSDFAAFQNPYQQAYTYTPHDPNTFAIPQQPHQQQFRPPSQPRAAQMQQPPPQIQQQTQPSPTNSRKRRASEIEGQSSTPSSSMPAGYGHPPPLVTDPSQLGGQSISGGSTQSMSAPGLDVGLGPSQAQLPSPAAKKGRTNTPWTPAEEQRLKTLRDAGSSWSEIAKTFPTRTEGSVKKHWYKDMHYAEFAEDEVSNFSAALLQAIKDYENNKWKVIGQKVGKPAKACEQFAKEQGWKV